MTKFGRRKLRKWVAQPLFRTEEILVRQKAIAELMDHPAVGDTVSTLKRVPDVERLISRLHNLGLPKRKDHPDSSAVFYNADALNKANISSLCKTLDAMQDLLTALRPMESVLAEFHMELPKHTQTRLDYFKKAFDWKEGECLYTHVYH